MPQRDHRCTGAYNGRFRLSAGVPVADFFCRWRGSWFRFAAAARASHRRSWLPEYARVIIKGPAPIPRRSRRAIRACAPTQRRGRRAGARPLPIRLHVGLHLGIRIDNRRRCRSHHFRPQIGNATATLRACSVYVGHRRARPLSADTRRRLVALLEENAQQMGVQAAELRHIRKEADRTQGGPNGGQSSTSARHGGGSRRNRAAWTTEKRRAHRAQVESAARRRAGHARGDDARRRSWCRSRRA